MRAPVIAFVSVFGVLGPPAVAQAAVSGAVAQSVRHTVHGSAQVSVVHALARARATGRPLVVSGLTTATSTVTAEPDGRVVVRSYALPVRARRGGHWVAVKDPSSAKLTAVGDRLDYDPVESGAGCTGPHWNAPGWSPVGYDNFQQGPCEFNDTDYALYRMAIPQVVFGSNAVIDSASFQVSEVYTTSCTASPYVTATWIGAINSSTGWPGPPATSGNVDVPAKFGPDPHSCDTVLDTSQRVSVGLNVTADLQAIGPSPDITFRVWEKNNTNDVNHKQLTDSPVLQIDYTIA
ncbi:MAG TPA: hypothetical protein VGS19_14000 [Streptosporangiaceae bacterium]|nr:hypothetical protein [Streptosporangiaceae bacterium]